VSTLGDALAAGLSALNSAASQPTIEYRSGTSGAWTELAGCHFSVDQADREYSDQRLAEVDAKSAVLIVPESGDTMAPEYQVRLDQDDARIWAVVEGPSGLGASRYMLMRQDSLTGTLNRGRLDR
jgi:hypothetical protein